MKHIFKKSLALVVSVMIVCPNFSWGTPDVNMASHPADNLERPDLLAASKVVGPEVSTVANDIVTAPLDNLAPVRIEDSGSSRLLDDAARTEVAALGLSIAETPMVHLEHIGLPRP